MSNFTAYHKDPREYPFLEPVREKWPLFLEEYLEFQRTEFPHKSLFLQLLTPATDTIKSKNEGMYSVIGLFFHGHTLIDFIDKFNMTWPDTDAHDINRILLYVKNHFFIQTQKIINNAIKASGGLLRTVYFSTFSPGLDIRLHVNRDKHEYRGYLGLSVPPGDVAMKICHETLKWRNGEFMVLDHDYPHCPHNRTSEPRVALIVDFLKPELPFESMCELENDIVMRRMKNNPYSYGVFGTDDVVSDETFRLYGMEHQLSWKGKLS